MAQRLKCLLAMQETWVQSLGQEDPLEKEMVTHSSILAWRTPWTEEPGGLHGRRSLVGYSPRGRKELDTTERLHFHFHFSKHQATLTGTSVVSLGTSEGNITRRKNK